MSRFCALTVPQNLINEIETDLEVIKLDATKGVVSAATVLQLYNNYKLNPPMISRTSVVQALYRWRAREDA